MVASCSCYGRSSEEAYRKAMTGNSALEEEWMLIRNYLITYLSCDQLFVLLPAGHYVETSQLHRKMKKVSSSQGEYLYNYAHFSTNGSSCFKDLASQQFINSGFRIQF
jgi:hypothetical protein